VEPDDEKCLFFGRLPGSKPGFHLEHSLFGNKNGVPTAYLTEDVSAELPSYGL